MDKTNNFLILCTGNSARSQMAEAYLKRLVGDSFKIYSDLVKEQISKWVKEIK